MFRSIRKGYTWEFARERDGRAFMMSEVCHSRTFYEGCMIEAERIRVY